MPEEQGLQPADNATPIKKPAVAAKRNEEHAA
jgi:hypothetical protein